MSDLSLPPLTLTGAGGAVWTWGWREEARAGVAPLAGA